MRVETESRPNILAHGRDPNFPGWPDTLQLDYANAALQAARIDELIAIAGKCDGVRCDMAMLLLPEIFQRTWGDHAGAVLAEGDRGRAREYPGFTFLAEVYWDLEWTLQQQGFDYCYDKRLYDRLREGMPAIRDHLRAGLDYQDRLARFLENHDEPRAAATFLAEASGGGGTHLLRAGAALLPSGPVRGAPGCGCRSICAAARIEPTDPGLTGFYDKLLAVLKIPAPFGRHLVSSTRRPAWPGNRSSEGFVSFAWAGKDEGRYVAMINYNEDRGQCCLPPAIPRAWGKGCFSRI